MSKKNKIKSRIFSFESYTLCFASCIFLQTPVFKGEERNRLEEIKQLALAMVNSKVFLLLVIAIIIAIGILIMYNRKKAIPELTVEVIQDDTWFTTRDDNNRVGIVVSVNLNNTATKGIYIKGCKLSGYSAKDIPPEIFLKGIGKGTNTDIKEDKSPGKYKGLGKYKDIGKDTDIETEAEADIEAEKKLDFPAHKHFCRGQDFYLGPFSSESMWCYYESRMITMKNVLETPLTIRDSEKRRKTLRLRIPRHPDQRAIYKEMSKIW